MKFSYVAAALLSLGIGAEAGVGIRDHKRFARKAPQHKHQIQHQAVEKRAAPRYLNSKTAPFAVNGSGIPEVNFDIGETYAGLLPIDDTSDRELYFWYVPTENPAACDEILIWLNGGPGCSSLDGFFHENGPVVWYSGTYLPVQNTFAWSNLTNVVWVEQPVGTGYSRGTPNITDEIGVAEQFKGFWKNFIDTFDLHNKKVYVTGESYAGMYVPYIADAFIADGDKTYFDVNGILIYDPSVGDDMVTEVIPTVPFIEYNKNVFPFNDTYMAFLTNASAACGYDAFMEEALTFPPKGPLPPAPGVSASGRILPGCDVFDGVFNEIFWLNPCFDIYQVTQLCPLLWDVLGFPYSDFYLPAGFDEPYFNRTDVKQAINAPLDANWEICSSGSVFRYPNGTSTRDHSPPSGYNGGPLGRVVEATNNVVVGHGTLDMVLIMNGTLMTLQNLTWNGAQGFSEPPTKPFYVPYHEDPQIGSQSGAGIFGSWTSDRGMTFVSTVMSGHMIPEFQGSSSYRHLELLLGRIANLSEVSPFSTQPWVQQNNTMLGNGTSPI